MKNRVLKQLLTASLMVIMTVSISPFVAQAGEIENSSEASAKESNTIEVTENDPLPTIYDENGILVSLENLKYDPTSESYYIIFMVENSSQQDINLFLSDVSVDDFLTTVYTERSSIISGKKGLASFLVQEKDFSPYGIEDFSILDGSLSIMGSDVIFSTDIQIEKGVFEGIDKKSENSSDTIGNESSSQASDLESQISSLEESNKELEEKNQQLKQENKRLEEKIEKLQQENEALKGSSENKDTPQNTAPAKTPVPSEGTENTPSDNVVEYKDATTIRIVQQALNEAGYSCGNPDGVAGENTATAIKKYQTEKGISVNGLVTDELLQALDIVEEVQDAVEAEASKAEYSGEYTYDQLARNPDTYKNQKMKFTGTVVQEGDAGSGLKYVRLKINSSYDTILFITYSDSLLGYRLLEDDTITVYGKSCGLYSYESTMGAAITIPWIHADIIEM